MYLPFVRLMMALAGLVMAAMILWVGALKESTDFWTFQSPYPVWFRNLVKIAFYPAFALEIVVFTAMTAFLFVEFTRDRIRPVLSSLIMVVNWTIVLITLWLVMKDNL